MTKAATEISQERKDIISHLFRNEEIAGIPNNPWCEYRTSGEYTIVTGPVSAIDDVKTVAREISTIYIGKEKISQEIISKNPKVEFKPLHCDLFAVSGIRKNLNKIFA